MISYSKLRFLFCALICLFFSSGIKAQNNRVAYDIDMAKEICSGLPLESVEGVWLYPQDKVTVLILNDNKDRNNSFPSYSISVVDTSDARLHPGEKIGTLRATAQEGTFEIELSTEKKNSILLKPKSVLATLSKDGESFLIKRQNSSLKGRLNINFSRLLPGFWKMVSTGIYTNSNGQIVSSPVGMLKLYPSYDGNGSSRRKVRYL